MPSIQTTRSAQPGGSPPRPPARFGDYEVLEQLGAGGMGTVYLCRRIGTEERFAVKVLHPSSDPVRRRRFEREAKLAASLDHPGIVRIHEVGHEGDRAFLVMERLEGTTLARRLTDGPLSVPRAIRYAKQLAEALATAHAAGIVHRDVKPANVMVSSDGESLTLVDFGVATLLEHAERTRSGTDTHPPLTRDGAWVGTLDYMAPEQLRGEPADERTDLFALGSVLHAMLTGAPPFSAPHPALTAHRILHGEAAPLAMAPGPHTRQLRELLEGWLAPRPRHRPASMAVALAQLESLERGPLRRPRPWRSALAAVGLSLLLLTQAAHRPQPAVDGRSEHDPRSAPPRSEPGRAESWQRALAALDRPGVDGHLDLADGLLRRLAAEHPNWAAPWAARSRLELLRYRTEGRDVLYLDRARAAAERATELEPTSAVALAALGRALVAAGEPDRARPLLERALALDEREPEALRGLGELYSARGELEKSLEIYRRAVAAHPRDPGFFNRLGSLHYRRGQDELAREAFERSLELAPESIYGYRNLAAIHHRQGRISEAADALEKALEIRPGATLYTNLGTLRHYQGRYEEAAAHFERALAGDGGAHSPLRWANLGDSLRQIPGRAEEAESAYRRATQLAEAWLERHPDDVIERSRLAQVEAKRGRCEAAETTARRIDLVRSQAARDSSVPFRLALAAELCGERDRALELLAQAVAGGYPPDAVDREPELVDLRSDLRYHRWLTTLDR